MDRITRAAPPAAGLAKAASVALLLAALAACGGGGADVATPGVGSGGTGTASGFAPDGRPLAAAGDGSTASPGPTAAPAASPPATAVPTGTQLQQGDFTVNSSTAGHQGRAVLAPLAGGGFVAVWSSSPIDGAGDVRLQRYDALGRPAGGEAVVAQRGHSPGVAPLAGGGFLVTWGLSPYMYEAHGYAQRYDAQGTAVGGPIQLAATFFKYLARPMGLPDGGFVVAVDTIAGRYGAEYGMVVRHAADGTPVGEPTRLTSQLTQQTTAYDPNAVRGTTAAGWADGRFVAAWVASGTGVSELRLTRFDAQAHALATTVVASGPALQQPALAALPSGQLALAWVDGAFDAPKSIHLEWFDGSGVSLGRQVVAAGLDAYTVVPRLAALADGGLVLAWHAAGSDDTAVHQSVTAQRFTAAGQPAGAAQPIATLSVPNGPATAYNLDTLDVMGAQDSTFLVLHGSHSDANGWDVRGSVR